MVKTLIAKQSGYGVAGSKIFIRTEADKVACTWKGRRTEDNGTDVGVIQMHWSKHAILDTIYMTRVVVWREQNISTAARRQVAFDPRTLPRLFEREAHRTNQRLQLIRKDRREEQASLDIAHWILGEQL